jgi:4'-phosphopantetheinyl transferase
VLRWLAVAPDDPAAVCWNTLLDDAERARADRFRFAADRAAYTAVHALLRRMLADAHGLAPERWRFRAAAGGKPEIDPALGRPRRPFSLSHTRGMVACAVGWGDELGVDVESLGHSDSVLEIARRNFAPAETAMLEALPPAARASAFGRLWTLKEAYLKATGQGLAAPLDGFCFSLDPVAINFRVPAWDVPSAWQFAERNPGPGFSLALAVRRDADVPITLDSGLVIDRCLTSSGGSSVP